MLLKQVKQEAKKTETHCQDLHHKSRRCHHRGKHHKRVTQPEISLLSTYFRSWCPCLFRDDNINLTSTVTPLHDSKDEAKKPLQGSSKGLPTKKSHGSSVKVVHKPSQKNSGNNNQEVRKLAKNQDGQKKEQPVTNGQEDLPNV